MHSHALLYLVLTNSCDMPGKVWQEFSAFVHRRPGDSIVASIPKVRLQSPTVAQVCQTCEEIKVSIKDPKYGC